MSMLPKTTTEIPGVCEAAESGVGETIPYALAGWSDLELDVYRRGEDQAFLVSPSVAFLRPWSWEGVPYRDECPIILDKHEEALRRWDMAKPVATGHSTIGEMLVWASVRTQRTQPMPPDEDDGPMFAVWRDQYDWQSGPFGSVFNRRLLLEVLHASLADGCTAGRPLTMRLIESNGCPLLIVRSAFIEAYMMSAPKATPGNDPMPGQWAR